MQTRNYMYREIKKYPICKSSFQKKKTKNKFNQELNRDGRNRRVLV